jgi:ATP-dependent DNA helicase RecQ
MSQAKNILLQYWHHDSFRGEQEAIIEAVIAKKDVLALLPTGGGKSVCFQVPALMNDGLCLVISPLIALMKDQVLNLENKNIAAAALYSGMGFKEVEQLLIDATNNEYKFLYVSPERLESKLFKAYLSDLKINLIAVDEAHCISQWGYDFRPPYLKIAKLRDVFPKVPLIALTASATALVQKDIVEKLMMKEAVKFQQSFEKPNLSYSVFKVESKVNKVIEILQNVLGSSIVYCKSRKLTTYVSQLLNLENIVADFYHAGLPQDERSKKQEDWIQNKTRVIVCTNAFGMGIDKPDVSTVIHYDVPDCLENYYQEAGRAGRNGNRAFAVLLYHSSDIADLKYLPTIRFPSVDDIRKVYQSLANYLQIPVGMGEGHYFDFDVLSFAKNFQLDIFLVLNVLKTLEHEGHITVTENIFIPAKAQIIADKFLIEDFEKSYPHLEPVLKCLLRTYRGILENSISINEKQIAKLCRLPYEKVFYSLNELKRFNIIEYTTFKETPQIYFNLNRAPASTLYINQATYLKRKQQFELRVEAMLQYLQEHKKCRSQMISNYFDAGFVQQCGACDNCLANKNLVLTKEEFDSIQQKIISIITTDNMTVKELLPNFIKTKKDKFWKVMQFLQDEKVVAINQEGMVRLVITAL